MVETFEEAVQKSRQRRREQLDDSGIFQESEFELEGETIEEKWNDIRDLVIAPQFDPGGQGTDRRPNPADDPAFNVDLGSLDNLGLLEVIARAAIATLSTMQDVAAASEPATTLTISGSEITEAPNEPQAILGGEAGRDVPTRTLFLRAASDNRTSVAFGDDAVAPNNGFMLRPGESLAIGMDFAFTSLYMASEEKGEIVHMLGVY